MNAKEFQESITEELIVIKNRVRNLIGNRHWGEEGRYKEAILKSVLRKFLPNNISVGTGFIINSDDHNKISKQIDIIVYDNSYPVLFSESDFIITTMKNVKGIIEVKSSIRNGANIFRNIIKQFNKSIEPIQIETEENEIFLGIFAFQFNGNINSDVIDMNLKSYTKKINHISLGKDYFIRKWKREDKDQLEPPVECDSDFYNIYKTIDLSFSYFINNLLYTVCDNLDDREWFLFPIEGT